MSTSVSHSHLAKMISGYWLSQAVYAVAKLGLADLLNEAPQTAEQLAAQVKTLPQPLYRLLRALASVGVFVEDDTHHFSLTEMGQLLRSGVPGSQRAMAIMAGEEHYHAWGELLFSLQTGTPGFNKVFGQPIFEYLSKHPAQAAVFDAAMVSIHGRETAATLDAYDFSSINTLADIGGGNGSVLAAALGKYPNMRGILFDLPGVLSRAAPQLAKAGLSSRCHLVAGNFFESVPAGADAYLMRHIIHDWNETQCRTILANIHHAMPDQGRLLVIESVIPPGNEPFFGKLLDLNMLVIPGGRERTREEYQHLFADAGFQLTQVVPTATEVSILEGRKLAR